MITYDFAVIGSGPSACSAITEIGNSAQNYSVIVFTGSEHPSRGLFKVKHPKIISETKKGTGLVGLSEFFADVNGNKIFSTSILGGLANYWGQQFLRYSNGDPVPYEYFASYQDYIDACNDAEKLFEFNAHLTKRHNILPDLTLSEPRLLIGTKQSPNSALGAMACAVEFTLNNQFIVTEKSSIRSIALDEDGVILSDFSGKIFKARKVIVAAGVVGTLKVLSNSSELLKSAIFSDHSPTMTYFVPNAKFRKYLNIFNSRHFNSCSIEMSDCNETSVFASLYSMSKSSLGICLSAFGLPAYFNRTMPPKFIDLVRPIQTWTKNTTIDLQINLKDNMFYVSRNYEPSHDVYLKTFLKKMSSYGWVIKTTNSNPGQGFHYHSLRLSTDGITYVKVNDYLNSMFRNRVIAVDGSALSSLGVRPHTLTLMASSKKITSKFISTSEVK